MRNPSNKRRTTLSKPALAFAVGVIGLSQIGCEANDWVGANDQPAPVTPSDFVDESNPSTTVSNTSTTQDTADGPGTSDLPPGPVRPISPAEQTFVVNAMIGHINGEAVYAGQILEPIEAQLAAIGRREGREAFLEAAVPLVYGRLNEVVLNQLVLGEAERDLGERDRQRLDVLVQRERDEKLRYYGQGSLAAAQANYEAETGRTLAEHLRDYREQWTVRRYIEMTVRPRVVVNPRDVERYYDDNLDEFNRPGSRVLRLIIAPDPYSADVVRERLDAGVDFEQLARDENLNRYLPAAAGLFNGGDPISSDFGVAEVHAALVDLDKGGVVGPIYANDRHWFVQIVAYSPAVDTPFEEVKNQIEEQLRAEQFKFYLDRFRAELIERGSYTPMNLMMEKLITIAEARFDSEQ
ncbi:MAG: peptidylprolyl isomerase [Planctomycetota bacterium]